MQWPCDGFTVKPTISGLLVLDKPPGLSSREAVNQVTRLLPRVKMGHAGTLDPMATGVLVLCLGKATRLIPYVQRMPKEYRATLRLGQRSETHDLEAPVEHVAMSGTIDQVAFDLCLTTFLGELLQVPPQHSAVHVEGRRAYEWARAGQSVELKPRRVRFDRLVCKRFEFPEADLEIECSSGTYVRSLIRDLGEKLGCGAVMTRLVRTAVGSFHLEGAIGPDNLTQQSLAESLRPVGDAVRGIPVVVLPADRQEDVRHGRAIDATDFWHSLPLGNECTLVDEAGHVLAVAEVDSAGSTIRPRIVLCGN